MGSEWVRGTVGQTETKMWSRRAGQHNSPEKHHDMTTKALFVKLVAKPGKETEVAKFLRDGQGLVQQEPATTAWFGIQLSPTTFAIFDAFPDEAGREAHLLGKVAKALMEKAPELLAEPPNIEKADVLADRLLG
jgi:quinol monooxygenase YgiN